MNPYALIPNPLAILGELRTLAKSIKKRYEAYQGGQQKFHSLCAELDLLLSHLADIEHLLRKYPNALPSAGATLFQEKLVHVRDTFKDEVTDEVKDKHAILPRMVSKAFAGSSISAKPRQVFLANTLDDKMNALITKIDRAANQLANLVAVLLHALKVDESVASKTEIQANRDAVLLMLHKVAERVTPRSEIWANHDAVMLMLVEVGEQAEANHDEVTSKLYKIGELVTPRSETRANHEVAMSKLHEVGEHVTPRTVTQENHEAVMSKLEKVGEHVTPRTVTAENHGEVLSTLHNVDENVTQLKNVIKTSKEDYHPSYNTPTLSHTVVLDFCPTTSLGKLKQSVLYGESSEIVTAATGAIGQTTTATTNPAYGVVGMAGVGKTVALKALGHDEEVKKRFRDGVLYMTFGRKADRQTAIDQIAKIMDLTGATTKAERVTSCTSLVDAVDYAASWFKGRECLHLIDDLWPAQYLPPGYFQDLRQLLRESPNSRMAISTRSHSIANDPDCVVNFSPGETHGKASVDIFMAYTGCQLAAKDSAAAVQGLRPSLVTILSICSGLPIALSVAGCAVSELVELYGAFEKACDEYASELRAKEAEVGSGLRAGILLSLEYLEVEFAKLVTENSLQINHGISDLYTSLCVLSNQTRIPLSVLRRLWNLSLPVARKVAMLFQKMSLAKVEPPSSSAEEPGLVLHDLHLAFCQRQAEATNKLSFWQAQLLNGYLKTNIQPIAEDSDTSVECTILSYVPRPWWCNDVPEDGYIHANLARHLSCAGRGVELAALLLDARWTKFRARIGGLLALESDFEHLRRYLSQWKESEEVEARIKEVKQSFENIFKVVRLSWGRLREGMRAFQFQVCASLQRSKESNATVDDFLKEPKSIADAYLKSVVMNTPKPYLLPLRAFLVSACSALITEIPVGGVCESVACSPCGQYIAAGAGHDIVIAKTSTGEVLRHMFGHTGNVTCVKFAAGSKKIVSGGHDGKIIVWEWESSCSPVRVLQRKAPITGLAVHKNVFFSTDGSLEVWDISKREESRKLKTEGYERLTCLDVCGMNGNVAVRTYVGGLMVLDSDTNAVVFEENKAYKDSIRCAAFSPSGQYLAIGGAYGEIDLWDVSTEPRRVKSFAAHGHYLSTVAFSPDGMKIVSGSRYGTILVWDVECGECDGISGRILCGVTSVSFTSDGKRIISGSTDGIIRIWDACLEKESKERDSDRTRPVLEVSISRNGLRVATASADGMVRLWNTQTGEQIGALTCPLASTLSVALSPDGRKLVSGSGSVLQQWNTGTCTQIGEWFYGYYIARCVVFSCDGRRIISGSSGDKIQIWNAETHEEIGFVGDRVEHNRVLPSSFSGADKIPCVAESDDGSHVVSRHRWGRIIIRSREALQIVWDSKASERESGNSIQDDKAENIIRSCGPYVSRLWPKSFSSYTDELYCEEGRVYSNLLDGRTIIAQFSDVFGPWEYNSERKVFAFGLASGDVAICKLIVE